MRREQKVWCIVFEESQIQEAALVRTERQCSLGIYSDVDSTIWRIKDEEKIKELDSLFGLQDRWGSEWYINFHLEDDRLQPSPRMIVCSSLEKAYWYLRNEIRNRQQEIEGLEYILATKKDYYGLGLQLLPRPHFELAFEWLKQKTISSTNDTAWAQFHYYL